MAEGSDPLFINWRTGNPEQVGTGGIADGAVTTPKIADGAVTTPKIADGAVTEAKLGLVIPANRFLARVSTSGSLQYIAGVTAADNILPELSQTQKGINFQTTSTQIWAAASGPQVIVTSQLESAAALQAVTEAATITWNWDNGINFAITLTANRNFNPPTNGQAGTWRTFFFIGDGATPRTLTFLNTGTEFWFGPDLTSMTDVTSTKFYVVCVYCLNANVFLATIIPSS